jgi:hypothetical protein
MNLTEYADALNVDINLVYRPSNGGVWIATIDGFKLRSKENAASNVQGKGSVPGIALTDLANKIKGKDAFIDFAKGGERAVTVPKHLEHTGRLYE